MMGIHMTEFGVEIMSNNSSKVIHDTKERYDYQQRFRERLLRFRNAKRNRQKNFQTYSVQYV